MELPQIHKFNQIKQKRKHTSTILYETEKDKKSICTNTPIMSDETEKEKQNKITYTTASMLYGLLDLVLSDSPISSVLVVCLPQ
jgi:hypothetical protein